MPSMKRKTTRSTRPKTPAASSHVTPGPGRPSKLTSRQWEEIRRRLAAGESTSALAREFKVSKATISGRCSQKVERLKTLASKKISVDAEFDHLPISEQAAVINLVDQMKATTTNLATAARHGSATSARLAQIANRKAVQLDPAAPDPDDLRMVSALIQTSNQAATIGTAMLTVTKNDPQAKPAVDPEEEQDLSLLSDEELYILTYLTMRIEQVPMQFTTTSKPGYIEPGLVREVEKCLAAIKENRNDIRQWAHPSAERWDADWRAAHLRAETPVPEAATPDPVPAASPVPMLTAGVVDEEEDDGQAGIYRAPIEDFSPGARARDGSQKLRDDRPV